MYTHVPPLFLMAVCTLEVRALNLESVCSSSLSNSSSILHRRIETELTSDGVKIHIRYVHIADMLLWVVAVHVHMPVRLNSR